MGHTPTLNGKIPKAPSKAALNHYDLARTLINYQSFDTTDQCMTEIRPSRANANFLQLFAWEQTGCINSTHQLSFATMKS